jgi:hypothetical protein
MLILNFMYPLRCPCVPRLNTTGLHKFVVTRDYMSQHSSVSTIAMGWMIRFQFPVGAGIFLFILHPDWLWGLSSLLSSEYQGLFLQGEKNSWSMKLTSLLHLLLRLRKHRTLLPLHPLFVTWCLCASSTLPKSY